MGQNGTLSSVFYASESNRPVNSCGRSFAACSDLSPDAALLWRSANWHDQQRIIACERTDKLGLRSKKRISQVHVAK